MKQWIIGLTLLGGVFGASLPLINVAVDQPVTMAPETFTGKSASFADASKVFETSCLPCHSSKTRLPWYAQLPVASQIIGHDMEEAREWFNMETRLYQPGAVPDEIALAKIEYVMHIGEMPPLRYWALHWRARLSETDIVTVQRWINDERQKHYSNGVAAVAFASEPVQPIPTSLNPPAAKAALGEKLFHDTRLSGNQKLSCASCHGLQSGGVDNRRTSLGIHDQEGPINAPTVYNAAFNFHQFWDGRAKTLHEQALGPVTNPIEMGGDWAVILPLLNRDAAYRAASQQLFGGPLTKELVAEAIAAFEMTLITPNSPFDRYLKGDKAALTAQQQKGYALFKSVGCVSCHAGVALGGQSFEKMGRNYDYFIDRGNPAEVDFGRYNVTQLDADQHYFKVPLLRNIALTGPYYHDGSVATLTEAVDKMAYYQLDRKLNKQENADIVAFLESLTGEYHGKRLTAPAKKP